MGTESGGRLAHPAHPARPAAPPGRRGARTLLTVAAVGLVLGCLGVLGFAIVWSRSGGLCGVLPGSEECLRAMSVQTYVAGSCAVAVVAAGAALVRGVRRDRPWPLLLGLAGLVLALTLLPSALEP